MIWRLVGQFVRRQWYRLKRQFVIGRLGRYIESPVYSQKMRVLLFLEIGDAQEQEPASLTE